MYYEFEYRVDKLRPHQVLAINRGEAEKVLRVRVMVPERDWQAAVSSVFRPDPRSPLAGKLVEAVADAAERLLLPAIERDVRRALTEKAEAHAISVFAANLSRSSASRRWPGISCWALTPASAPAAKWP